MRLRRSWRTFGINRCRPARRGVSILWVCSRWWVHVLFLLQPLHRAQLLPASLSHFCLFAQDSLAAEIEGTMRKELQMDDPDVEEQRYSYFPKNPRDFQQFYKKGLGFMHRKRWEWYMHLYFFQSPLQAPTKASFPDGEKPEPDASAAFIARSVPSQHPGIQSDVVPHVGSLQPCGHTALQLYLWGWGGKWDHPGQQGQQYSGESRWWVGKQI